jgi:F-type H+-transporting ATPase subunit gamma
MANARDLRRRIRSIGSTAQITKAMQMVAVSKMRKAQQLAIGVRPFVQMLYEIQRIATSRPIEFVDPLLAKREVRTRAVILVASDKGLCGALNSNLFRLAGRYEPTSTKFIAAGRKAAQFIARTRRQLVAEFPYGDTPRYEESRAIGALARDLFVKGEVDEVRIIAARFVNTLTQQPVDIEFLPVGSIHGIEMPWMPPLEQAIKERTEFLFEPDARDVLNYLLRIYVNTLVHVVLLNAKASEQSARMVSMSGATSNAEAMIKDLTLEYNKLRQGRITQELLEIQGGQAH